MESCLSPDALTDYWLLYEITPTKRRAMSIKHRGNRRFDGSDPAYSKEMKPIKDLLRGLRHIRVDAPTTLKKPGE